jgi:hypothetical protein
MRLKTRLGILIGFVVVFLVSAPITILYTSGYRWNWKKQRIEKIGVMFLRSKPNDATVMIDGETTSFHTPARITNLLPGTYDVRVNKVGFSAWEKHLTVQSELTTFAEGIQLWKDSVIVLERMSVAQFNILKANAIADATKADDRFVTDGFAVSVTHKDGNKETITRLGEPVFTVLPYPSASYVLYQTRNSIHAVELDSRDQRNDTALVTYDGMTDMAIAGTTLYFVTKKDGDTAIFSRQLQ